nr:hypothetical protein [Desulfobulbaceae bacterium]
MKRRKTFNPKRQIQENADSSVLAELQKRVSYSGNPEHKRNPGDFGLIPPALPRPDKTLCDEVSIFTHKVASQLLQCGIKKGLISVQMCGNFPQNVWAVSEGGFSFEAQLDNFELGSYHGYPMPETDPFRAHVLEHWSNNV